MRAALLTGRRSQFAGRPGSTRLLASALAGLATLGLGACSTPNRDVSQEPPPGPPAEAMVVAEHPLAVSAGLAILDAGGNAADAAVATALALAVVYPQAGNLGGGGLAIVVPHGDANGARAIDFRETAPAALTADLFLDGAGDPVRERSLTGHLAAGVPGSAAGLTRLHQEFGSLSLEVVALPAIRLALDGFPVDPFLARDLRQPVLRARLEQSAGSRALFYPGGEALSVGQILRQPELAKTLQRLASEGPQGFYRGPVADAIAAEMRRGGGVMTAQDLAGYTALWSMPLRGWFRGREVITMPPPSSGGVLLLQVMGMLSGLPLDADRENVAESGEVQAGGGVGGQALHWWIEAMRLGFADRAEHLGDPGYVTVPIEQLLAPKWIAERRVSIGPRARPDVSPLVLAPPEGGGETTHLCVLDGEGNAVSMTTTLNTTFGSGVLVPGAGFLLNNEMDDFSMLPGVPNAYGLVGSEANSIQGGKRPLSSMTPTVVLDDRGAVELVIGSPGGPRIISSVLQVALRLLVYEQTPVEAVLAPRVHQQWKPLWTSVEPGFPEELAQKLEARGHELHRGDRRWASVQVIQVLPSGDVRGASDPRRGGVAGRIDAPLPEPAQPVQD